jgi:hypothetical protein
MLSRRSGAGRCFVSIGRPLGAGLFVEIAQIPTSESAPPGSPGQIPSGEQAGQDTKLAE